MSPCPFILLRSDRVQIFYLLQILEAIIKNHVLYFFLSVIYFQMYVILFIHIYFDFCSKNKLFTKNAALFQTNLTFLRQRAVAITLNLSTFYILFYLYIYIYTLTSKVKASLAQKKLFSNRMNACVCYFLSIFIFSLNDSPSETMNVFYFI